MARKSKQNYINNEKFYEVMVEYKTKLKEAKKNGTALPKIPNYIGECFLLIANRLATKPSFANYSWRDEMCSDGIITCIQYMDNFDEEKYKNPFAYFTMIIWRSFLNRIQKEKKQQYVKYKMMERQMLSNDLVEIERDEFFDSVDLNSDVMNKIINDFEEKLEKNSTKKAN